MEHQVKLGPAAREIGNGRDACSLGQADFLELIQGAISTGAAGRNICDSRGTWKSVLTGRSFVTFVSFCSNSLLFPSV
jgi:hypothetical protein